MLKTKNDNTLYFPKDIYIKVLEDNVIEINGKKINRNIIRNIFYSNRLFNYTLKVFQDKISFFRLSCEEYSKEYKDILLSKTEVLLLLNQITELDAKNPDIEEDKIKKEDLKIFADYCSYNKMLDEFKEKTKDYKIEGTSYKISFDDMWNFYNCNEEEYQKLLKSDTINGIKKEHFIYACIKYFDNYIVDKYILPRNVYQRFKSLSSYETIDIEAINVLTENENPESESTRINKQLRSEIFKDIPESLSKLEKAIYIYIKMCKILSYDDEFYALNQRGKKLTRDHRNIDYINSITPLNPKIVCYEFNAIYAKLLEELGINCVVDRNFFGSYGKGHASLGLRIDKYLISADSTVSILNGDMIKAKLNEPLNGLCCVNTNKNSQNEFNTALNKVYNTIINSEKKKGLDEIIAEYRSIKEKEGQKKSIDVEKKLNILASIINRLQVSDMDRIAFAIYLLKIIFTEEERNYIHTNIIKSKESTNNNEYASPTIIFTIKEKNQGLKYYRYLSGQPLSEIEKRYIEILFSLGILEYIKEDDNNKIPNIRGGIR